jgi:hypothetical protein
MIGTMTASLNGAQGYSMDGTPGDSPVVAVRLAKADHARLAAIAKLADVPLSRVIRVAIKYGQVKLETEGLPDDGQSAVPDNEGAPAV